MGRPHKHVEQQPRKRQEISLVLKVLVFSTNFLFWLCGMGAIGLGIYTCADEYRPLLDALDLMINPANMLLVCGSVVFVISFLGCTGALRENVCMLKLFGIILFLAYIILVIVAFLVFLLFYSDAESGFSVQDVLFRAVKQYSNNDNMRDMMDYLQVQLKCCGVTDTGYKEYNLNSEYNCSRSERVDPRPERCGVPWSCCYNATSELLSARCGFNAQQKASAELEGVIYTLGCLKPLQKAFEKRAVVVGAAVGAIIIPVCIAITMSNLLWKQVERQRWRLERQAKREERWRRKMRRKFRDPMAYRDELEKKGLELVVETANLGRIAPVPNPGFIGSGLGGSKGDSDVEGGRIRSSVRREQSGDIGASTSAVLTSEIERVHRPRKKPRKERRERRSHSDGLRLDNAIKSSVIPLPFSDSDGKSAVAAHKISTTSDSELLGPLKKISDVSDPGVGPPGDRPRRPKRRRMEHGDAPRLPPPQQERKHRSRRDRPAEQGKYRDSSTAKNNYPAAESRAGNSKQANDINLMDNYLNSKRAKECNLDKIRNEEAVYDTVDEH